MRTAVSSEGLIIVPDTFSPYDLTDKVAVITGGARGIGRAAADLLRSRGARLVVSDLADTVRELDAPDVATYVGDASTERAARATIDLAVQRFGRLDILVNNAGRTLNKPITETSAAEFDGILAVNARGNFLHAREAFRVMQQAGGGSIVSIAFVSSVVASKRRRRTRPLKARSPRSHNAMDRGELRPVVYRRQAAIDGRPPHRPVMTKRVC